MIPLLVALGGAIGAVTRYGVGLLFHNGTPGSFPWATFFINVTGSLLLGFIYRYIDGTSASAQLRALYGIGFCGGFTTFSTFSYDAVRLMQDGHGARAATYIIASVLLCISGTFAGLMLGGAVLRR